MTRPLLIIGVVALLIVAGGTVAAGDTTQGDGLASMLVDDLVVGESEHRIGPTRMAGFDESARELVLEIDLTVLERHGVDVSDAAVDLTEAEVDGGSLRSMSVEGGIVTVVIEPEERGILIEAFRLTGLETENAEAAPDVAYDVTFSAGTAEVDEFDIVDPDGVSPTVSPRTLWIDEDEQRVSIEGIRPADGDVTVELDVSVLEDHGASLDGLEADAEAAGATVRDTSVRDGVVTVVVAPEADQTLFDVVIELAGFEFDGVDADARTVAADVAYEARIEGADDDGVTVEPFDIVIGPLTAPVTGNTGTPTGVVGEAPGFGPMVALIALVGGSLLAARRP